MWDYELDVLSDARITHYNEPREYSLWNMFEVGERYVLLDDPKVLKKRKIRIWARNVKDGNGGEVAIGSLHLLKSRFRIVQPF